MVSLSKSQNLLDDWWHLDQSFVLWMCLGPPIDVRCTKTALENGALEWRAFQNSQILWGIGPGKHLPELIHKCIFPLIMIWDRSTDVVPVLQNRCAMLGTTTGRDGGRSNSMLASRFVIAFLRTAKRKCFANKEGGRGEGDGERGREGERETTPYPYP